jgi:SHS2 domain-containing protein
MRQISVPGKYTYLNHTADIKIESFGKSFEESFVNLAKAISSVLLDISDFEKIVAEYKTTFDDNYANHMVVEKELHIQSQKISALLFDYIDELLYLIDTEKYITIDLLHPKIKKTASGDFELHATTLGIIHDASYQSPFKAPTYNEMVLEMDDESKSFRLQVVIDI